MTKKLTTKQRVARYIKTSEGSTIGEIARRLNLSVSVVSQEIRELKDEGIVCVNGTGANGRHLHYPTFDGYAEVPKFGVHPRQEQFNQLLAEVRA
ncbi:MarR family transcriptional regulator [Prodigiosinella confusarubida]|uniref:MarR family transcriptional regulator n=1 Tax=Serratia sp. (strain ATCC 39006) TaxID=104623 RepID=A0A2I5T8K7_SERS3|nr:helix-turn-helix domain-containing protein [Serratia sp. ATCC 39006]AUH00886.1 MarR family transcriptional regulator [Serratia sp. ATCC 39006]AUH05208.1 MarR family transcriptional regulator [Serratia sp. ATCC 39006]